MFCSHHPRSPFPSSVKLPLSPMPSSTPLFPLSDTFSIYAFTLSEIWIFLTWKRRVCLVPYRLWKLLPLPYMAEAFDFPLRMIFCRFKTVIRIILSLQRQLICVILGKTFMYTLNYICIMRFFGLFFWWLQELCDCGYFLGLILFLSIVFVLSAFSFRSSSIFDVTSFEAGLDGSIFI